MSVGERKLAAIMFTDIVGYTALMQNDEARAMVILNKHNELLRPIFLRHQGKEIKTIGDAFLLEFGSALQALETAVEVQETLLNYNKGCADERDRVKVRIGIHLGDVIYQDGDVFGDSVNIASRIQPLADPGGICVTASVYDQVWNKMSFEMLKAERVRLKNVTYPVDVYHVVLPWEPRPKVEAPVQEPEAVPLARRLAILPFVNLSQDPEDDYFVDGMTDELITTLSNVKDLRVIARSSTIKYKETTKGISEIAGELKVGTIIEGTIRKLGTKIRVTVQMVDGKSEEHLFATSYDRDLQDIFAVQTDVAKRVSRVLKAKIRSIEKARIQKMPTLSSEAYNLYLRGRFVLNKRRKESMEAAAKFFQEAIDLDARFARAYAGLADAFLLLGSYGYLEGRQAYGKARESISKALELDRDLAEAHVSLGFLLETYYYDFPAARKEFESAISLNPSYAQARHWFGLNLAIFGEMDEAAAQMEKALEEDPLSPQIATVMGALYIYLGRDDDALRQWGKALLSDPDNVPVYLNRAVFHAKAGRRELAMADMKKAIELTGGASVAKCILGFVYAALGERAEAERLLNEMVSLSENEYVSPWYLAIIQASLGNKDEFFRLAEKAIEDRSAEIESLANPDATFESVTSDPRYGEILKKVGIALNHPYAAAPRAS